MYKYLTIFYYLENENFENGISLADLNAKEPTGKDFKMFPGVFLDESGSLNLLYSITKETLDMVTNRSESNLNQLNLFLVTL